ncbi:PqiC family protein [Burkholderia cenocepacia]|uniref:PqiC family protein n=1 Tax=Burkholderia cenocepacia TaxID=95486 RepID=UPI00196A7678|nr:PqiC family protein [Burkholderia cenocepacia]MBN3567518.1 membrane integrity-associated transporter subunit PqiC [Burkholderia cenocepacia]MBR8108149.1 membrane integrity-associated transporter subunit PqiC [Burkholderia cenocepacia]
MTTRVNGLASGAAALLAALALAACSSPPARFYTLSPADAAAPLRTAPANPAFLIEVPSVGVPEQVAKSQLVVQKNAAQVDVLEQERWASPPADEIRRALSDDLAAQLGTIDVANSAYPAGVPVYRISVNVQRFESWPGKRAAVDAVWSVRSLATQAVMTCRTSVAEPVADGYDALVAGHRRALDVIATQAAAGVRAMAARRGAPTAPAAGGKTAAAPVVPCPANPTSGGDAGATGKSGT